MDYGVRQASSSTQTSNETFQEKRYSTSTDFDHDLETAWGDTRTYKAGFWTRIYEGFKRDPDGKATSRFALKADGSYDADSAAQATANSPLSRKLKGRHLQMIALGGSIGE